MKFTAKLTFFVKREFAYVFSILKSRKYKASQILSVGFEILLCLIFSFNEKWVNDTNGEFYLHVLLGPIG